MYFKYNYLLKHRFILFFYAIYSIKLISWMRKHSTEDMHKAILHVAIVNLVMYRN